MLHAAPHCKAAPHLLQEMLVMAHILALQPAPLQAAVANTEDCWHLFCQLLRHIPWHCLHASIRSFDAVS